MGSLVVGLPFEHDLLCIQKDKTDRQLYEHTVKPCLRFIHQPQKFQYNSLTKVPSPQSSKVPVAPAVPTLPIVHRTP